MASGPGLLVLIVGPSGAGKDSLIAYCRERLEGDPNISFPRRAVTRPPGDPTEDHIALSEPDFDRAARRGAFALHWGAHGLFYGVPATIEDDLHAGRTVIVNVSRAAIPEARERFRPLLVVSVTVPPEILAARIAGRGREDAEAAEKRIARAAAITVEGPDVVEIDNSGPLEVAGDKLLALLARAPA